MTGINRRALLGAAAVPLLGGWQARAGGFATLPAALARIERERGGRLGVAVLDAGSGARAAHRGDERFPMTSTFKLPLAAAVLARADAGLDRMDRVVTYPREDLVTYSPATAPRAGDGGGMTLAALCEATVTLSDNTAGNLLLRALGGPGGLTAFFRTLGDGVSRLDRWETALNEGTPGDPRDTTSPDAMLGTLRALALGDALRPASRAQLLDWLRRNTTGDHRLRAGLPPGWSAGEKTGTGGHHTSNDVGLLWPPGDAPPILVAAYLTEGPADPAAREATLAAVAAAVVSSA